MSKKTTYKYAIDRHVTVRGKYREIKRHVRAKSDEEFARIKSDLQAQADRPEMVDPTVREWSEVWLKEYNIAGGITKKAYEMYPRMLRLYILPVIGDRLLSTITEDDCDRIVMGMRGKSKSYQHQMLIVLRAMLKQAKKRGLLQENPATDTTFDRAKDPVKKRPITCAERDAIERAANRACGLDGKPNYNGGLFLLTLRCGLRPGEVCALRKEDLDLVHRYVHVRQARERGSGVIKGPKTSAGARDIPIPGSFASWLQCWLQTHQTHPNCPYVFAQRDGTSMITESSYDKRWKSFKRLVDLELGATMVYVPGEGRKRVHQITKSVVASDLVPYNLRVTYATDCVKANVQPPVLQRLMGHTSIDVTMQYYVMVDEELLEQGRDQIDAYNAQRDAGAEESKIMLDELADAIREFEAYASATLPENKTLLDIKTGESISAVTGQPNKYSKTEITAESELAAARRALAAMQARVAALEKQIKR